MPAPRVMRLWIDCKSEFVTFSNEKDRIGIPLWIDCKSEFVTLNHIPFRFRNVLWIDCKSEFVTFEVLSAVKETSCGLTANLNLLHFTSTIAWGTLVVD